MGFGTSRDKLTSLYFEAPVLSFEQCGSLWRGDDMAARAVEIWPNQMLRVPFGVKLPENKDAEIKLNEHMRTVGLGPAFKKAIRWQRAYGGAAILLGIEDGLTLDQPVDATKVKGINWLNVLNCRQLIPGTYYTDPASPKLGQVRTYQVAGMAAAAQTMARAQAQVTHIHESRLLIFDGFRTLDGQDFVSQNNGWGDSVLVRMYNALRGFGLTWEAAYHLMSDNSQGIYGMKGLVEMLHSEEGGESLMAKRMRAIDMSRSVMRSVVIDPDSESFTRVTTPMTGVADMLDRVGRRLSAAADMPYVILLGESPGGLGSNGNAEITAFYDRVDAMRVEILAPPILYFCSLLANVYGIKEAMEVTFDALWTPTQLETAQARNVQAQTDATYINASVLDPDEVAASRFGRGGYSFETQIDMEARASDNEIFNDGERNPLTDPKKPSDTKETE